MTEPVQPVPPVAVAGYQRFDTLADYRVAIDQVLARATREIFFFDTALAADFDRPERIERLRSFLAARSSNRLVILLHDAGSATRTCPRLCALLRRFSEGVSIRQTLESARAASDPLLVVDASHAVRRLHFSQPRSVLMTDDPGAVRPLLERIQQIHEASEPAVSATVLGL